MGNNHPNVGVNYSTIMTNNNNTPNSIQKSGKLSKFKMTEILGLRRQSTGNEINNSVKIKNNNRLFTQSAHQSIDEQFNSIKKELNNNKIIKNSSLPQIEINNGNQNLIIKEKEINNNKNKAQKVDSRKIAAKKRLERGQTTGSSDNSSQNAKKSSFSERTFTKSLDNKYNTVKYIFIF